MRDARSAAFPPIADYGFLSDCETTALVASSGDVEWLCLPRIDSPSVFGAMLDRGAGSFRVGPARVEVPASRRYVPGTLVLETTWRVDGGWLVVLDALLVAATGEGGAPQQSAAAHVLLRFARCVSGAVDLRVDCRPLPGYARESADWSWAGDDDAPTTAQADAGGVVLKLASDLELTLEDGRAGAETRLGEGETCFTALAWGDRAPPQSSGEAERQLDATSDYWRDWLDGGRFPDHPWRSFLERSALTLRGLTFAPTGAVAAAATTSLPETPGGERNWDYRFTWVRDSALVLWALHTLRLEREANDFYSFLVELAGAEQGNLRIMYALDGGPVPEEEQLDHLSGYEGAAPVRIGNGAHEQAQHDAWGALLAAAYLYLRRADRIDDGMWTMIVGLVEQTLACWREPDHGIWEVRGEPRHFTASKVVCWLAADRGARLAEVRGEPERVARWREAADAIKADVLANALDERGVFCQHYETTSLDAALLTIPLTGFLPADDRRVHATVMAIADELSEDDFVLRYRVEETDDGLSGREGTFTLCSFWLVSALVQIGEVGRAKSLCEKLLSYATPLQLYAEEIDPHTGRHLGNFPQAYTHLGLINAVVEVIGAEQRSASEREPETERAAV